MKVTKRLLSVLFLLLAALPLAAQEKPDTVFLFRFVPDKDMFYSPWNGNGDELARLEECIEQNRAAIEAGQMFLLVESFATSANEEQTAAEVAKIRRNRVKSEMIVRCGVKEEHFVTDQDSKVAYSIDGKRLRNVVVVVLPASVEKVAELAGEEAAAGVRAYYKGLEEQAEREKAEAEQAEAERIAAEQQAEKERLEAAEREQAEEAAKAAEQAEREAAEQAEREQAEEAAKAAEQAEKAKEATPYHFALRANLLRWATLTPDLGIEWRVNRHIGILVNGTYTSWSWQDMERRYALWEVNPELRWYLGEKKRGYVGAMFKAGSFNYKFSEIGKQGDLLGGGVTGGYQLKLNDSLTLDFSLGLGYLQAEYETYKIINNVRVRQDEGVQNWWGPVQAGVSLVWTIF